MQVSTKLFNKQSVENFSDLTAQIQKKQEQVATGKHLTEPSDDPVKAGRVMVVKEQKAQTEQLTWLSGRTARFHTAVTLRAPDSIGGPRLRRAVVTTRVRLRRLTAAEIARINAEAGRQANVMINEAEAKAIRLEQTTKATWYAKLKDELKWSNDDFLKYIKIKSLDKQQSDNMVVGVEALG